MMMLILPDLRLLSPMLFQGTLELMMMTCLLACLRTYTYVFISASIGCGQIMGWGEKAIEVRSVETGHLDGVFMHKRAQTFRFLCERNEKVRLFILLDFVI